MPKYGHCWFGQAKPSVCIRLGAPRRLFTSLQGRTGVGSGSTTDEWAPERRQSGQSSWGGGLKRPISPPQLGRTQPLTPLPPSYPFALFSFKNKKHDIQT